LESFFSSHMPYGQRPTYAVSCPRIWDHASGLGVPVYGPTFTGTHYNYSTQKGMDRLSWHEWLVTYWNVLSVYWRSLIQRQTRRSV